MKFGSWWVVSLVAAAGFLSGCWGPAGSLSSASSSAEATPAQPKRISVGVQGTPKFVVIRPAISAAPGTDALEQLLTAGLTRSDNREELQSELAEAVPSAENSLWKVLADGRMETTWKIRANARWHDGTAFTAEDLLFTARLGQDRDLTALRNPAFESVESMDAPDPHTLVVHWKQSYIFADRLFTHEIAIPVPKHLLENYYGENKEVFAQLPYWTEGFVGTGPYRLRDWVGGSHAVIEANDQYVLGRPKIDEIEIRFIRDANALMANILAGTVEITLGRGLSLEQAVSVRDQWGAGRIEVAISNWFLVQPQMLTPSPAVVGNAQFRRAMMYAIDRQEMSNSLQGGLAPVAHSFISPSEALWKEVESAVVKYDYDPRRAAQILEGLGYAKGSDGMLRDGQNQQLALEIRTTGGDASPQGMLIIADFWQQLGIAVDPVVIAPQRQADGEYRANFPGFQFKRTSNTMNVLRRRLHSSEAPLPENRYTGGNDPRYMNPEMDALLDRFVSTVPRGERAAILSQIMRRVTDDLIFLGMFHIANPTLIHDRLSNVTAGSASATAAWNAHEWALK